MTEDTRAKEDAEPNCSRAKLSQSVIECHSNNQKEDASSKIADVMAKSEKEMSSNDGDLPADIPKRAMPFTNPNQFQPNQENTFLPQARNLLPKS